MPQQQPSSKLTDPPTPPPADRPELTDRERQWAHLHYLDKILAASQRIA